MESIEQRLKAMEEMVVKLAAFVGMREPGEPTIADFDSAIQALRHGDKKPLEEYMMRGKAPSLEAYKSWSRETYGDEMPSTSGRRYPDQALRRERQKSNGKGKVVFIGADHFDCPAPQRSRKRL